MTCTLILMRHAKSSWGDPTLSDHDRPLNGRGRRSVRVLGEWLRAQGHLPDQALVSSSRRTQETYAGLRLHIAPTLLGSLYHAWPDQMMGVLVKATEPVVLMLGHNPGIAALADQLAATAPTHARFSDYPTGATTILEFESPSWATLRPRTGRVVDFVVPRELGAN